MTELIKKCFDETISEKLLDMYKDLTEDEIYERIMQPKISNGDIRKAYEDFEGYWTITRCYIDRDAMKEARLKYRQKIRYSKDKEKMKDAAYKYYKKKKDSPEVVKERKINKLQARQERLNNQKKKIQDEIDYISEELEKILNT